MRPSGKPSTRPMVRVAVFLLGMSALLNLYATQPILKDIAQWAHITETKAAWTISATTAGVALTAPIAGMVSDRLGRRRVLVCAVAVMALLTLSGMIIWSYPILLTYRFLLGMCCPFVFAVTVAYLSEEYDGTTSAKLNSLYVAGTAFGGFAGRMIAAVLTEASGYWRLSFLGNAVILGVTWIIVWRYLPQEQHFPCGRGRIQQEGLFADFGAQLRNLYLLATCAIGFTLLFQQVAAFTFVSLWLSNPPFLLSTAAIGMIFIVFLVPTVTTPIFGRIYDRLGVRRGFMLSQLLSLIGLAMTAIPTISTIIFGLALSCVGVFAGQAAGTLMVGKLVYRARSTAVGLYLASYYLGGAFGGIVPGPLYSREGWEAVVLLLVLVVAIGTVLALFAWRTPKQESS